MWRESWQNDPLRRLLNRAEGRRKKKDATGATNDQAIPDLLADNGHLSRISMARDAVRSLLGAARQFDRQSSDLQETCTADMQQYLVFLCCRVIGGQQRDLTEKDRRCLQQVLGFDIPSAVFQKVATELRTRDPEQLDRGLPKLLILQAAEDHRIYDPCDSTIRNLETVGKSTARIFGDATETRENMVGRMALQWRWLVDTETERLASLATDETVGAKQPVIAEAIHCGA